MWFSLISWDSFLFFSLLLPWNNTTVLYLHCYCALFPLLFLCEEFSLPFFVLKNFYIASLLHCNFFSPKEKKKKMNKLRKKEALSSTDFRGTISHISMMSELPLLNGHMFITHSVFETFFMFWSSTSVLWNDFFLIVNLTQLWKTGNLVSHIKKIKLKNLFICELNFSYCHGMLWKCLTKTCIFFCWNIVRLLF